MQLTLTASPPPPRHAVSVLYALRDGMGERTAENEALGKNAHLDDLYLQGNGIAIH